MKFLITLIAFFSASFVFAEDLKIATVDMSRILNESTQAKAKRQELSKLSESAKKKVDEKKKTLTELEAKLKAKNISAESEEADQFRAQARDFARMVKDTEDDLKKNYLKFSKALSTEATKIINDYADKNGITLVLEKSGNAEGPVVFRKDTFDITDQVLKVLEKSKI